MNFLPAGILRFLIGKMIPVPSMRSCSGRFLPMPSGSRRPNSLDVSRYQMGASGPFRSFWSDTFSSALIGVVLRAAMWWSYLSLGSD